MRISIIFMAAMIVGLCFFTYLHEQIHVNIFNDYDINSTVEYFSHFPGVATIGESACPTETCKLSHNINDIIGYHLLSMYFMIGLGIFFILIYMEMKDDEQYF